MDGAGFQAAVGEVVLQPLRILLRQAVAIPQAGPAVGAIHELVAEAEDEVRVADQIGDGADTQLGGHLFAHADGVGVVEPEWRADLQSVFGHCGSDPIFRNILACQYFLPDGAGVLGIHVEVATQQGVPQHARAAQFALVCSGSARFGHEMGGHFAQDDVFRERLRADAHGTGRRIGGQRGAADEQQGDGDADTHVHLRISIEHLDRRALSVDETSDEWVGRLFDEFLQRTALDD